MKLNQTLLGTVAAGSILLTAAAFLPTTSFVTPAVAATNVSVNISISTFYDRLSPYGDWVSFRDRWVFVPEVEPGWRPYTRGHWVYTDRHGWVWASNERFGWATFHYGRWGYGRDIGWYWVPGRRWAPAWVAWSRDDDDIAWAPLPPDYDDDNVGVSISITSLPEHYWQVVPASAFLSVDLSDHIYRDRDRVRRIVSRGEFEPVRIENDIVVNNVINVNFIEEKTNKKVVVHKERHADNPQAAGKTDDNSVAIFNAEVQDEPQARPKKVRKTEEVARERKSKGFKPEDTAADTEEAAPSSEEASQPSQGDEQQATGDQAGKKRKKPAASKASEPSQGDDQQAIDQGDKKQKKPAATEASEPQQGDEQQATEEQGSKKRKKPAADADQIKTDNAVTDEPQKAEQTTKKKRNQSQAAEKALEPPAGQDAVSGEEQPAQNKKKCDPSTQDCQAQ